MERGEKWQFLTASEMRCILATYFVTDVHIKIGKKRMNIYLLKIMNEFNNNNKVVIDYMTMQKGTAEMLCKLLDNGGCTIGKEYSEREAYIKHIYAFNGEQSTDGKGGIIEFFPENKNLRIFGNPKDEIKEKALELVMKSGQKQNLVRTVFRREVYR